MNPPGVKYLRDYHPPDFTVETIELHIDLHPTETMVTAQAVYRRSPGALPGKPLVLDGKDLTLVSMAMDGRPLNTGDYQMDNEGLTIAAPQDEFRLTVTTRLFPQANTALEGLYQSGSLYCTQCEATGFRKITYFPDRPDVMAVYTCTITADQEKCPVLLANGNLVDSGRAGSGRHFARWHDPFKKPSYLFAMVAGDLGAIEDHYRTLSGRNVRLRIFVEKENLDQCAHAMASLKKAMQWDERVYGREYDLDDYMIVAVKDFNMGAMENKGLNIFNAKYVLAKPETATDTDFQNIEGVIAHEYFHNWTGNRITLRNWFQLSLKEGLTVFRDQEFSADMASRAVKRIADVRRLRTFQFPEDSGPMAHPVRPESYIQMNNFYTQTVYEKGAEVIRMLYRLLGHELFRRGMDLYFSRHDGQAVTTDDFVAAMEAAAGRDFSQFRRWYSQAGTPQIAVSRSYDAQARRFSLTFHQSCPPTPGQPVKLPLHMPMAVGLLRPDGSGMPLSLGGAERAGHFTEIVELRDSEQTFCFEDVDVEPIPSLLRGFSAPVKLSAGYTEAELALLLEMDPDPFSRWDAGQQFIGRRIHGLIEAFQKGDDLRLDRSLLPAMGKLLSDKSLDQAFAALMLTLPAETETGQQMADDGRYIDPDAIHWVRGFLRKELALALRDHFLSAYFENQTKGEYRLDSEAMARRALKNTALSYLSRTGLEEDIRLVYQHFYQADNMTDELSALTLIADYDDQEAAAAVNYFFQKWQKEDLVIEKWFAVQAAASSPQTLARVRQLLGHPCFSIRNPNKVRALIGAFCGNPSQFHQAAGHGYKFLAEQVKVLDGINPQIAARMVAFFNPWKKYNPGRQEQMRRELEQIRKTPGLSSDVAEIVEKALS